MMRSRTVVLIGALALAAGWMGGNLSQPAAQDPASVRPRGPRPLGVAPSPAPFTEQLRERLEAQPRSPVPGRNPFSFGSRRTAPPTAPVRPAAIETPAPDDRPAVVAPPPPVFTLSGIASDLRDGVAHRTAILMSGGEMLFAEEGDALPRGYRVLRVEDRAVVLVDATGAEMLIRLP